MLDCFHAYCRLAIIKVECTCSLQHKKTLKRTIFSGRSFVLFHLHQWQMLDMKGIEALEKWAQVMNGSLKHLVVVNKKMSECSSVTLQYIDIFTSVEGRR